VALAITVSLGGCSKEITGPGQPSPTITADEYVALAALMDTLLGQTTAPTIALEDSTGVFSRPTDSLLTLQLQYVSQHLTTLTPETMLDFRLKNITPAYIDSPKIIHRAFVRSSETDIVFPSCTVSRVGFSSDGGQALVYAGFGWSPRAGGGDFYLLSRVQGAWVISGSVIIWIS
jgi:hypothetical protein